MSAAHVELRAGAYADSVALLQVSRAAQEVAGVQAAQVAMATDLNLDVLASMGFDVPDGATPHDMVVAIRVAEGAAGREALERALAAVDDALRDRGRRDGGPVAAAAHRTTATAVRDSPGSLVLVSVPGRLATLEAMDALDAGHDVMVFSDNVPVEHEVALKQVAERRGLLVMGPDCGTAVVGGVGLGFANVVRPGPVAVVAASGTGCQQLLALLDHAGVGVGSALGVGGRDLSAPVGGRSTLEALRRLDADPGVELVVVVSKPPADEVARTVRTYAEGLATPVELALLGAGQPDLTAAAERVLRRLGRDVPTWPVLGRAAPPSGGTRLCGLFVGGTLCSEARLVAEQRLGGGGVHTFTDFGDDEYTAGRAHPMIDPTLRLEHLQAACDDPRVAVLLLDVVLGHGAEPDPADRLAPVLASTGKPVVVSLVGTAADPQGLDRQAAALVEAGAEVHWSNAGAARRAADLTAASASSAEGRP